MTNAHPREWLVEIRVRDYVPVPPGSNRIVGYEEVIARSEVGARHLGFDQFEKKCKYSPITKRRISSLGVTVHDCCAPDAVEI